MLMFDISHHKTNFYLRIRALGRNLKKYWTITLAYESFFIGTRRVLRTRDRTIFRDTRNRQRSRI